MAELTVDLTYGSALFQAAEETGKKDLILEEACEMLGIFEQEPDFYAFINYPAISAREKKDVLKKVFQDRICQELLNLLYVLVDKGRTRHFPKIIKAYKEMINHEEGYSYGSIYSVEPLKPEQLAKFEEQTSQLMQTQVKLENQLDPKLIGGVKILVDGRIIDASIRKRFEDLGNKIL
ncbi:ATP synthase F1 subunit delta [Anaerovorax odorimutans]|uniref:ATP synthase subunit delta n=1 Tax=Anaerovorax odorimutans TaxID=109327 RepID=A0ABT1RS57_9FIRM|nr:ATP synthase F1 subunit delta [Anaerovorax odorimutans]MCQ4638047.1 ATP synthase F1 subunit delta [Anaerovorax odorimutans]